MTGLEPRHAAALALVGLYLLMAPPLRAAGGAIAVPGIADTGGQELQDVQHQPRSQERVDTQAAIAKGPQLASPVDASKSAGIRTVAEKPLERRISNEEAAKGPPFSEVEKIWDDRGNAYRVVSLSVHVENGSPVWCVGTTDPRRGKIAPPDLQARIVAEFAKYTTTPAKFEPGHFWSSSGESSFPNSP